MPGVCRLYCVIICCFYEIWTLPPQKKSQVLIFRWSFSFHLVTPVRVWDLVFSCNGRSDSLCEKLNCFLLFGEIDSNPRLYCWKKGRIRPKGRHSWWAILMRVWWWLTWCEPRSGRGEWTSWSMMKRVPPYLMMVPPLWSFLTLYTLLQRSLSTSPSHKILRYHYHCCQCSFDFVRNCCC